MNLTASVLIRAAVRVGDTCSSDEAFRQATRFWTGAFRLGVDDKSVRFTFDTGALVSVTKIEGKEEYGEGEFGFDAPCWAWKKILVNPKARADFSGIINRGEALTRTGDRAAYWLYYPAFRRFLELLSEALDNQS